MSRKSSRTDGAVSFALVILIVSIPVALDGHPILAVIGSGIAVAIYVWYRIWRWRLSRTYYIKNLK